MSEDLIRRKDAIKAIWGDDINPSKDGMVFEAQSHIDRDIRLIPSADRSQEDYNRGYCDAVQGIADEMVKQGKYIVQDRPRGEWIPCSERLPREEEQDDELGVLVTLGNGYSGLQYDYCFNGLWDDWNGYVIAWMPLPAPWEGADDE